jgi:hypothetical protein
MGIISGFIKGSGYGAGQAGKMMLADKLAQERDEANFMRDSQLKRVLQTESQEHSSGLELSRQENLRTLQEERIDSDEGRDKVKIEADKESAKALGEINKEVARIRSSSKTSLTDKERNAATLIEKGYPVDVANGVAFGAIEEIKDADTGDMFLVNTLTNKKIGRMTTVNGRPDYIPEGGQSDNAEVTAAHRALAKKRTNKRAKYTNSDDTDFPETDGDRKAWRKQEEQRIANAERDEKNAGKETETKSTGIVGTEAETITDEEFADDTGDKQTKMIEGREVTAREFLRLMKKEYPKATDAQIKATWEAQGK